MPLSFFTNSGNSYGSAIPFQRIVEPAQLGFFLNLEQSELLRIQRYNEHWRFYFGRHWLYKREDGEPLVTLNYFRKFIDKIVSFTIGKGFNIGTPKSLVEVTKPFLDEVWEVNNKQRWCYESATMSSVTGDMFALITFEEPTPIQRQLNPYSQGHIRINLLGSEQVYPTWDPLNQDTLIAARIETIYYAERGTRQLDREDRVNHEGRQLYTKRFTQIITPTQIVEQYHGDMPMVRPNALGEIPLVHIKNLPIPKEFYGLPDGMDLVDLQREYNEKSTDVSDVINYHSAPTTIIYGAKAKQLERGAKQLWSGLPKDAKVENLMLGGDLNAAIAYLDRTKRAMHELGDVPEGSLGQIQPISNTSGVALHMANEPLIERRDRKAATLIPGLQQINYFILRIGQAKGLIRVPFDLCKHCGGRIVMIDRGRTAPVWNPDIENYEDRPVFEKRCYHIDKQTLEFILPEKMRMKIWRQYGFGAEIREMEFQEILKELERGGSFWDWSLVQRKLYDKWVKAHTKTLPTPPQSQPVEGEMVSEQPEPQGPQEVLTEKPPPWLVPKELPVDQVDVPEEPERVEVVQQLLHPVTGAVVRALSTEMFLVPTGCQRPEYQNPFETEVTLADVLPKDEALRAALYVQYQTAGWVDEEWCQDRIPEIAENRHEIRRRMKALRQASQPGDTAFRFAGTRQVVHQEAAPPPQVPEASEPGPNGPVPVGSNR